MIKVGRVAIEIYKCVYKSMDFFLIFYFETYDTLALCVLHCIIYYIILYCT